ncbi:hypothetical protein SRHO_G00034960 [Serrasalmus rhombeus]
MSDTDANGRRKTTSPAPALHVIITLPGSAYLKETSTKKSPDSDLSCVTDDTGGTSHEHGTFAHSGISMASPVEQPRFGPGVLTGIPSQSWGLNLQPSGCWLVLSKHGSLQCPNSIVYGVQGDTSERGFEAVQVTIWRQNIQ